MKKWLACLLAMMLVLALAPAALAVDEPIPISSGTELLNAVKNSDYANDTLKLTADIAVDSMVNITVDGITLDLGGHTLTASASFTSTFVNNSHLVNIEGANVTIQNGTLKTTGKNKHVVNVYQTNSVTTLKNVTLNHADAVTGAPLVVNSSSVTTIGITTITGRNSWYAANVDKGSTMKVGGSWDFKGSTLAGIWLDSAKEPTSTVIFDQGVKLTAPNNFPIVSLTSSAYNTVEGWKDLGLMEITDSGITSYVLHTHTYGDWQSNADEHWKKCSCGDIAEEAAHTARRVNKVKATCTQEGYTGDRVCSVCGYVISTGTKIDKLPHSYGETWKYDGENHWKECSVCGDIAEEAAHDLQLVGAKEPTTTEEGYTGDMVCAICGYVAQEGTVLDKLPAQDGWVDTDDGEWYFYEDGEMIVDDWHKDGGSWYYLGEDGKMLTGWQELEWDGETEWYYFNPEGANAGAMATGWQELEWNGETDWYYMDGSGAMLTGWQRLGGKWYYLNGSGAMATGWQKLGGVWYYLDPVNGDMKTGWQLLGGKWYYLQSSGAMLTGWQKLGGVWYYLDPVNGDMKTGWQRLAWNGVTNWYYFQSSGAMATSGTIDGWNIASDGIATQAN